jgi:hypothetical protein
MPSFAILNNKIITASDIYKFNIPKTSDFVCFICDKKVQFRQQRNANNNFTEHFYHPNTNTQNEDSHIECEKYTLKRHSDTWHNTLSNFINIENREVVRKKNNGKHIVDAYDALNNKGIEFQNSSISEDAIKSRDETTYLDWIFNVENQYLRKVEIGNLIVCEIPHNNWENAVKVVKNKVFLYTGYTDWILLENRDSYHIEIEGKRRNVWIGKPCCFQDVYETTCLQNILTSEGKKHYKENIKQMEKVRIIYARCKKSMFILDTIHREYIHIHNFSINEIVAIKSVAGSGKTTLLLQLAKIHKSKKILYLAFNKSLITEIQLKLKNQKITNLFPCTFDSLLVNTYKSIKNKNPNIINLSPQTIQDVIPWLKGKPFLIRKDIVKLFTKFCKQINYTTPQEFCINEVGKDKPLLETLWKKILDGEINTFDAFRKLSVNEHWFKNYIDISFDMIMIDETQDFDLMMLQMLLDDTTIPKIFVGDPKQSIYQWRGCINGFDHMPENSLIIEFYSTFRIGATVCDKIMTKFDNCWMVSKSKHETILTKHEEFTDNEKYIYLFRTWRHLLNTAQNMKMIWISNFDKKIDIICKQHKKFNAKFYNKEFDNDEFEDDLPNFLKSISEKQLNTIISNIQQNSVHQDSAICKIYTIHSYKGLEDDYIRIANDNIRKLTDNIRIQIPNEEEENIYYVALTRGMKKIIED